MREALDVSTPVVAVGELGVKARIAAALIAGPGVWALVVPRFGP
jgi:hypothetical protein